MLSFPKPIETIFKGRVYAKICHPSNLKCFTFLNLVELCFCLWVFKNKIVIDILNSFYIHLHKYFANICLLQVN